MIPNFINKYRLEFIAIASIMFFILWGFLAHKSKAVSHYKLTSTDSISIPKKVLSASVKDTAIAHIADKPKNGIVKMIDELGKVEEVWTYKNGVLNGKYEYYIDAPDASMYYKAVEGYYKDGRKTGVWKTSDYYYDAKSGVIGKKLITVKTETFRDGVLNGKTIEFDPELGFKIIEMTFKNGKENGIRKNYCPRGADRGKFYYFDEVVDDQIVRSSDYQCKCDQSAPIVR